MKQKLFLFFLLCVFDNSFAHGLALNTLVQMKNLSTLPIEIIAQRISQKKLYVRSFDDRRFRLKSSRIKRCGISRSSCCVSFFVTNDHESDEVVCTPTQEFYSVRRGAGSSSTKQASRHHVRRSFSEDGSSVSDGGWVKACDLVIDDTLLCMDGRSVVVTDILFHHEPLTVSMLEIKKFHTFFVGKFSLLTHNVVFPMDFGVDIIPTLGSSGGAAGSSFGPAGIITGIVIGVLIGLGLRYFCKKKVCGYELPSYDTGYLESSVNKQKKKRKQKSRINKNNFAGSTCCFFPKGPDRDPDDEKNEKKHPHGRYEDVDYHHRNSKGGKSPAPKDGQQALDNSIPLPWKTARRIGVSCNEIVILDQTSPGLYHGHVRTWKELVSGGSQKTERMKNILVKNGLVSSSGKILL